MIIGTLVAILARNTWGLNKKNITVKSKYQIQISKEKYRLFIINNIIVQL